jgi:hypothetical protein
VQAELKKVWHRHMVNRTGSVRTTRTFLSRTRNSVKQPTQSNGNALIHSDVNDPKDESDATLLNCLQNETTCDNETQEKVFDTELTEDETSCMNNNRSVTRHKNNGSCAKDDCSYKSEIS